MPQQDPRDLRLSKDSAAPYTASGLDPRLACAWPRRFKPPQVNQITREELKSWTLHEDDQVLAVNKPGDVLCHPSKNGPCSSLAGAVREYCGLAAAYLAFRLDRETSGVVVFAKTAAAAARLQEAVRERRAGKVYLAVMTGEFSEPATVDAPLGPDEKSLVIVKSAARPDGQSAVTHFTPLARGGGFTLARVTTGTGRKHQIRAHAQFLGRPLAGDKIYGPDAGCFLEFIETGWTPALAEKLLLPRQALHCAEIDLRCAGPDRVFKAPLPADLRTFCAVRGITVPENL
jgi:23S rRNA pseudouridine1911/1915/1917 synthase